MGNTPPDVVKQLVGCCLLSSQRKNKLWRTRRDSELPSSATPTSLLFFANAQNKENSHSSHSIKHKRHHLTVMPFMFGGEGGIRTLEPLLTVTRFPIVRARPTTRLLQVVKYRRSLERLAIIINLSALVKVQTTTFLSFLKILFDFVPLIS